MRKVVIGIIIGVFLAYSGQALAESVSNVGKKVQGEYPVIVNGIELSEKATAVDGVTSTPNRALANALGLEIDFENKTVYITSKEEAEPVEPSAPTIPDPEIKPTKKPRTIEDVIWLIQARKSSIDGYEQVIKLLEEREETEKIEEMQKLIDELKQQLIELEAEKAALEAQQ